jgi:hypothetical protein
VLKVVMIAILCPSNVLYLTHILCLIASHEVLQQEAEVSLKQRINPLW